MVRRAGLSCQGVMTSVTPGGGASAGISGPADSAAVGADELQTVAGSVDDIMARVRETAVASTSVVGQYTRAPS